MTVMCWGFFGVCVNSCCRPRELSCVCCVCPWCHCSRWTMTGSCFCCLPCAMFCMLSSSTTLTPPSGFWKTAWHSFPVSFHSRLPLNDGKKTNGVVLPDYLSKNLPAFKMKGPIWLTVKSGSIFCNVWEHIVEEGLRTHTGGVRKTQGL